MYREIKFLQKFIVLFFIFPFLCFSQEFPDSERFAGKFEEINSNVTNLAAQYRQQREEYLADLELANPELASLEKRLISIRQEIEKIKNNYSEGKIPLDVARERLRALIQEEVSIKESQQYKVEKRLSVIIYGLKSGKKVLYLH
jgi:septal ring factor EnvC (AmiA/AmiB activator)